MFGREDMDYVEYVIDFSVESELQHIWIAT